LYQIFGKVVQGGRSESGFTQDPPDYSLPFYKLPFYKKWEKRKALCGKFLRVFTISYALFFGKNCPN